MNKFLKGAIALGVVLGVTAFVTPKNGPIHVSTNAELKTFSTTASPMVFRDGFTTAGDTPMVAYTASLSACSLNSGNGDDGSQVRSQDGKCWLLVPQTQYDVKIWGATGGGVVNDTSAINAAFASGKSPVYFSRGTYNVTTLAAPPTNTRITGSYSNEAIIRTTSATADVLTLTNNNIIIDRLGFSASVPRTAGAFVRFKGTQQSLEHFTMTGAYTAIAVDDATTITRIDDGAVNNSATLGQGVILYGSGTGTGPLAAYLGHVIVATGGNYTALKIVNLGDLTVEYVQLLSAAIDLGVFPDTGQTVASLRVTDSFLDHGATNLWMQPTGEGVIVRSEFTNVWFGSSTSNGIVLDGGTGVGYLDGVQFSNSQSLSSAGSGLVVQNRAKNVSWMGGFISANVNGIVDARSSGFNSLIVQGATVGSGNGLAGNTTGIQRSGAGDYAFIQGNNLCGNTTAYTTSNTGTHNRAESNACYNPVGNTTVTPGASPWTYTNGEFRSTLYSFAGTVSNIAINGVSYFNAACSPCVIPLDPNDTATFTYTVAPSVNVKRN